MFEVLLQRVELSIVLFLLVFTLFVVSFVQTSRKRRLPPGPWGWPIVGNLWQLGDEPHMTLTHLSRIYGDVYRLKLGSWPAIIINNYKYVREALVKQGSTFASRPDFPSFQYYAAGKSISFQPYTTAYRIHRKTTNLALRRLLSDDSKTVEAIIHREGLFMVEQWNSDKIDPSRGVVMCIAGILYSLCFGDEALVRDNTEYMDLLIDDNPATELFGAGSQVDLCPWVRYFTKRKLHVDAIRRMSKFFGLNCRQRDQHVHDFDPTCIHNMMDAFIKATNDMNPDHKQMIGLTDDHFLNTTIEIMSAGTDTSSTTLLWLLLYMAAYPDVKCRVLAEIDGVIGSDHVPCYADRNQLPLTQATILEVMRLNTIVPFGLPHFTTQETTLNGYRIPKEYLVLVNLWSVCRDAELWENPDQFRPSRFLLKDNDGLIRLDKTKAERFLPFSAGKRRCIGEQLGRMQVFIVFTLIMQRCQLDVEKPSDLDLRPTFGDILKPKAFKLNIKNKY